MLNWTGSFAVKRFQIAKIKSLKKDIKDVHYTEKKNDQQNDPHVPRMWQTMGFRIIFLATPRRKI